MSRRTEALAAVLRELAREVERWTDDQLDDLLQGRVVPQITLTGRPAARKRTARAAGPATQEAPPAGMDALLAQVQEAASTDAAHAALSGKAVTKPVLQALARALELPVRSKDTKDTLRGRIVEAAAGYRLRSAAIRDAY